MSKKLLYGSLVITASLLLAACGGDSSGSGSSSGDSGGGDGGGGDGGGTLPSTSTTVVTSSDTYTELNAVNDKVRHVRIEGFKASTPHSFTTVIFGKESAPTSSMGTLSENEFRVLLYGGAVPYQSPIAQATFESQTIDLNVDEDTIVDGGTVCFDIHDGSATSGPAFALWVSGQKGADCLDKSTLTVNSANTVRATWGAQTGAIEKSQPVWFRQSDSTETATVTLSTEAVLSEANILAATQTTHAWQSNTDWQQLNDPVGGSARHFRIEDITAIGTSSYWYAIIGEEENPDGAPTASADKLIVTGGRSHMGASWTYFRFGAAGMTSQFEYEIDSGKALYADGDEGDAPSTVCFDIGKKEAEDDNARIVFWASGANGADCKDRTTLSLDNALYDSTTDAVKGDASDGDSIWTAPYLTDKLNFIKTSNGNVTLGNVVVSSEPVVLLD